jgi:hypothetical protein
LPAGGLKLHRHISLQPPRDGTERQPVVINRLDRRRDLCPRRYSSDKASIRITAHEKLHVITRRAAWIEKADLLARAEPRVCRFVVWASSRNEWLEPHRKTM